MRFIKVLLIAMLVWAPAMANSVAHAEEGRTVAAEKSKKGKKAKASKGKKAKKDAKAKGKRADKKAAKAKGKKSKKVATAKKTKTHAPAEHLDGTDDPSGNFEVSPDMQDELPVPNNGSLTD
jgi:membrane protein involved in colicin uptake